MTANAHHRSGSTFSLRSLAVLLFFAIVGGFLLSAEHRAHAIGVLPWLLIVLLCPLMHVFMHGGHGRHGSRADMVDEEAGQTSAARPAASPATPHRH